MSAKIRRCVTWFIYFFGTSSGKYNCAKFLHCRICVTDFREGRHFCPLPIPWAAPKIPILNRVKTTGILCERLRNVIGVSIITSVLNWPDFLHSFFFKLIHMIYRHNNWFKSSSISLLIFVSLSFNSKTLFFTFENWFSRILF